MARFYHLSKGIRLGGVIFDMDGTLTKPCIDFKLMRERLGILTGDVLITVANYQDEAKKREAYRIIDEVEEEGRRNLELQPGIESMFEFLKENEIKVNTTHHFDPKTSLVTRNSPVAVDHFIDLLGFDPFSIRITRDSPFPVKPRPDCAIHICKEWELEAHTAMFVGDFRDDILCGRDAGNVTCLLNNPTNVHFRELADLNIHRLDELIHLLREGFHVGESR